MYYVMLTTRFELSTIVYSNMRSSTFARSRARPLQRSGMKSFEHKQEFKSVAPTLHRACYASRYGRGIGGIRRFGCYHIRNSPLYKTGCPRDTQQAYTDHRVDNRGGCSRRARFLCVCPTMHPVRLCFASLLCGPAFAHVPGAQRTVVGASGGSATRSHLRHNVGSYSCIRARNCSRYLPSSIALVCIAAHRRFHEEDAR